MPTVADLMPPRAALALGLAGLLPFWAAALVAALAPLATAALAMGALALYGVAILAFMGGCRWGFAAAGLGGADGSVTAYGRAVAPALWAFFVATAGLAAPDAASPRVVAAALALGFAVLLLDDLAAARAGETPRWWPALRRPLTLGAASALLLGAWLGPA